MASQTRIKNIYTLRDRLPEHFHLFIDIHNIKAMERKEKRDLDDLKINHENKIFEEWVAEFDPPLEDDDFSDDEYWEYKYNTPNRMSKKVGKGVNKLSSRGKKRVKEARSRKRTNRCHPTQQEFDGWLVSIKNITIQPDKWITDLWNEVLLATSIW
jgi:hypothetical protein